MVEAVQFDRAFDRLKEIERSVLGNLKCPPDAAFRLGKAWNRLCVSILSPERASGVGGLSTRDLALADFHTELRECGLTNLAPFFEGDFWSLC